MFQGKRMDCWTLDLILGLHIALHCDLCILDHPARLAALASQFKKWIVCVIHILQTFLNQWRIQVISGFATMTIGNSPKTAELGGYTAAYKRSQTSSCCICPICPVAIPIFQISGNSPVLWKAWKHISAHCQTRCSHPSDALQANVPLDLSRVPWDQL